MRGVAVAAVSLCRSAWSILVNNHRHCNGQFGRRCPPGRELAAWFYDRLSCCGRPVEQDAADRVLNEVNIPMLHSATLRALPWPLVCDLWKQGEIGQRMRLQFRLATNAQRGRRRSVEHGPGRQAWSGRGAGAG